MFSGFVIIKLFNAYISLTDASGLNAMTGMLMEGMFLIFVLESRENVYCLH